METKHTLGPWDLVVDSGAGRQVFGGGHRYPIARATSYWDGPGPRFEEADANAKLIVLAPQLLEALKLFSQQTAFAEAAGMEKIKVKIKTEDMKRINALIAKVVGAA